MQSDVPAKIVGAVMAIAVLALAFVNGQPYSILFDPVLFLLVRTLGQAWANSAFLFHGTSVLITAATLLLAALPALLAKRLLGPRIGFATQAAITCVAALGLAWPTLTWLYIDWQ